MPAICSASCCRRLPSSFRNRPSLVQAAIYALIVSGLVCGYLGSVRLSRRMLESSSARILPPPGRIGRMGVRETVAYFKDQNKFIENRVKEHGPVFKTGLFFRPTVLIGSKEAVQDFKKIEPYITESSLPPGFVKLHTPYSALNQKGAQLRACRAAYQQVLGNKAILAYFPVIKECLEEAVASIPAGTRDNPSTLNLMEQIRPSLFNVFFQLFAGRPSNKERERLFTEFNNGLLAVLDWDLPWTDYGKARRARDKLIADVKSLFDQKDAQTGRNEPLNPAFQYFIDTLSEARDEHGEIWSRERIATVAILFIWGAFEETAASVSNTLRLISQKPEIVLKIREELARVAPNGVKEMSLRDFGSLKYLDACLSESLRLVPPSGGGMRMATEDVELCGYHIPKGWVISADPRISNKLKENFGEDIDDFNPSRFVQSKEEREKEERQAFDPILSFPSSPLSSFLGRETKNLYQDKKISRMRNLESNEANKRQKQRDRHVHDRASCPVPHDLSKRRKAEKI